MEVSFLVIAADFDQRLKDFISIGLRIKSDDSQWSSFDDSQIEIVFKLEIM